MRSAYLLWFELQAAVKEQLYVKTGGLDFGLPNVDTFQALKASMDQAALDYEALSQAKIAKRYPQFTLKSVLACLCQRLNAAKSLRATALRYRLYHSKTQDPISWDQTTGKSSNSVDTIRLELTKKANREWIL